MKTEKDFKEIGKKVPYRVPPDFFDTITENTLQNAKNRGRNRNLIQLVILASAAASVIVVLFFSGMVINRFPEIQKSKTIVQSIENHPEINPGTIQDTAYGSDFKPVVADQEPDSDEKIKYQDETFENLLASLTEEELQALASQILAEIYFNELIEE